MQNTEEIISIHENKENLPNSEANQVAKQTVHAASGCHCLARRKVVSSESAKSSAVVCRNSAKIYFRTILRKHEKIPHSFLESSYFIIYLRVNL